MGRIPYRYVASQIPDHLFLLFVLGQLFLGYFSGPVEGLLAHFFLILPTNFLFTGPSFWDQDLWKITHLDRISFLPSLRLNESFMVLAGVLLAFNIIHRFFIQSFHVVLTKIPYDSYLNVWRATHGQKKSTLRPLLHLLPFLFPTLLQIAWLSHPQYNSSHIMESAAFIPFLCAWGLQFAHQVGRMILAHVTGTPFPVWDWNWVWIFLGALDANMPLLGR
jgi:ethanolaminephosphotransferase